MNSSAEEEMHTKALQTPNARSQSPKRGNDASELRQIFNKFLEDTTIPCVSVIHKRINIILKIIWFLIAIIVFSGAVYQSVELIENYRSYPSFLTDAEKINQSLFFPSVTICPLNLINWERVLRKNHSIVRMMKEVLETPSNESLFERHTLIPKVLNEVYTYSSNERNEVLYNLNDWLRYCAIKFQDNCSDPSFQLSTYSPYYGNCVTFNHGLGDNSNSRLSSADVFMLVAELKPEAEYPPVFDNPGFRVTIHNPGSAPVVNKMKSVFVFPGQWLRIGIDVYDIRRLPAPYASRCTEEHLPLSKDEFTFRPYQSEATPYSYSREECQATCVVGSLITDQKCIHLFYAVNEGIDELDLPLCDSFDYEKVEEECEKKCRKRCSELLYYWSADTMDIPHRVGDFKELVLESKTGEKQTLEDFLLITIQFNSNIYFIGKETPKYQLEDILGSIGGSIGLWIGVSILSALEIIELITRVLAYIISKYFFKS